MRVYKFGGASVKDAKGVRNLKEIVAQSSDDLMVVISAMGKTTNALERVVAALSKDDEQTAEDLLDQLEEAGADAELIEEENEDTNE